MLFRSGRAVRCEAASEIEQLRKYVKRLENVLRPFANHADKYADIMPDSMMVMEYLFRFRDAKEALNARDKKKEERSDLCN